MEDQEDTDARDEATLEWYDGFNSGYLSGFEAGITIGRDQGYEDCLYRIKQMAEGKYDPDLEQAIKILTGEE